MKNLEVLRERQWRLDEEIVAAASGRDRAFFVSSATSTLHWHDELSRHSLPLASAIDRGAAVAGMEFLPETEAIVIGMASGDLVLVNPFSSGVEVVGSIQGGILDLAASPDGELLAIASGLGQILVIVPGEWTTLHEFPIEKNGFSSTAVEISWRGDAKFFATSEYDQQGGITLIKIWERDTGNLHSRCETLPSAHRSGICWNPGGARIAAASSREEQRPSVTIFERNGLKKDFFAVTAPIGSRAEDLEWDCSGQVLKMVIRSDAWDAIQLWSCSNYHWYLKQEWRFPVGDRVSGLWNPEKGLFFMNWTRSGEVKIRTLGWKSAVMETQPVALVIDGPDVLITPLAKCIIPPPLFFVKASFPAPVNTVALMRRDCDFVEAVAAGLSNSKLGFAAFGQDHIEEGSELEGSVALGFEGDARYLIWTGSNNIGAVLQRSDTQVFAEFETGPDGPDWRVYLISEIGLEKPVAAVVSRPVPDPESYEAFIQLIDGSILWHRSGGVTPVGKFPVACPWMQAFEGGDRVEFVGLDDRGQLHFRGSILSSDCTGFAIHTTSPEDTVLDPEPGAAHLIYTTRQDTLHILRVDDGRKFDSAPEVLDLGLGSGKKKKPEEKNFNAVRVWERGARIVCTLGGSDVAVILQPSRGNLETVYPRGLILQFIESAIGDRKFLDAISCARRHRIDLNVIVDFLGDKEFASLASDFVKKVGKLSLVTELVTSLRNENVLETTYRTTLRESGAAAAAAAGSGSKMQTVLEALRSAVESQVTDTPSRELCLLTILARNDPPLLEEALQRIKILREAEIGSEIQDDEELVQASDSLEKLSAESALRHLIWLVDADQVFDAALGLYDLHLAAMVASNSQRDPKEFLPFLQELEDMAPCIMRYKIDCKLKRFASALQHLASAGENYFAEALDLVQDHPELFSIALSSFGTESQRSSIMEAWGDHFLAREKFEDAAISFSSCSKLHKAMAAYRAGGYWQGVLMVAGQLSMTPDEIANLALELREELQAMGRPKEAARIALEYCRDLKDAVGLLIEARDWMEVLRVCYLHAQPDLVDDLVLPSAVECSNALLNQFDEGVEKVGKYCARFLAVHQRRVLLEAKLKSDRDEDRDRDRFDDDTASETSSNLSGMSVYTRGTTKTAATGRTRARRQGRVRAGSPGEELALVDHLKNMAISPQLSDEIRSLLQALVFVKREDLSCKLQQSASRFRSAQAEAMRVIESNGITIDVTIARSPVDEVVTWSYQALER